MANILIIDDLPHRRDFLFHELKKEGYRCAAVSGRDMYKEIKECLKYDMAIINFFPDVTATWELQTAFKNHLPGFPVLVYMIKNTHSLGSLKSAVKEIVKKRRSRPVKGNIVDPQSVMSHLGRIHHQDKALSCLMT